MLFRSHTPSGDKSCDGMAMALRAGLPLRDMEMVQFHPTGLLAGPGTRMTGTVLEEGLRGSGGYLLDETGARFMFEYDKRGERATREAARAPSRGTGRTAPRMDTRSRRLGSPGRDRDGARPSPCPSASLRSTPS